MGEPVAVSGLTVEGLHQLRVEVEREVVVAARCGQPTTPFVQLLDAIESKIEVRTRDADQPTLERRQRIAATASPTWSRAAGPPPRGRRS